MNEVRKPCSTVIKLKRQKTYFTTLEYISYMGGNRDNNVWLRYSENHQWKIRLVRLR